MLPRASMHLPSVRSAMRRTRVMELDPACLESSDAGGGDAGETVKPDATHALPTLAVRPLTATVVTYAPGAKSARHHHAGSVWAYVLSGAIRSQNCATGPAKVSRAGDSFFESPGSEHLVSENASATESASLLAVHIADDGAGLTTIDK